MSDELERLRAANAELLDALKALLETCPKGYEPDFSAAYERASNIIAKHSPPVGPTPGPWATIGDYIAGTVHVIGSDGGDVCTIAKGSQAVANARLIAEAPAMRDMLKHIADVVQHQTPNYVGSIATYSITGFTAERVSTILNAIEGK